MGRALLALLLLIPQDPPDVELSVVSDAWPRAPRTAGQKFGMNTRDTLPTDPLGGDDDADESGTRARWGIVGVRIVNRRATTLEGTLASPQIPLQTRAVRIRPGEVGRYFFAAPAGNGALRFELRGTKSEVLAHADSTLDPKARGGRKSETMLIVAELQDEQRKRSKFDRLPRKVEVCDEKGSPLRAARLTFLHPKTGMMVEGTCDERGFWSGPLLVGDWQVFARAVVAAGTPTEGSTVAISNPRLYYLAGTVGAHPLRLAPDQSASIFPPGHRLSIVPEALADFLRYETPHARLAPLFLLTVEPKVPDQPILLHSTSGLPYEFSSFSPRSFMRASKVAAKGEIRWEKSEASLSFDPTRFPGGPARFEVRLSFPDAVREVYSLTAAQPATVAVPKGLVRVELTVQLREGRLRFAPHLVHARPGKPIELGPTAFRLSAHYQETRGLMLWIALEDDQGKVVTRLEGIRGALVGSLQGRAVLREDLTAFTFHYPNQFDKVNRSDIRYDAAIELPGRKVEFAGKARARKVFLEPPGSIEVPEILEERARAMLPTIRKTLAGSQRFLGAAKFDLKILFEIRLPPEVGGMGGGGVMLLDLGEILEYAHETDRLPGAYTHELGHNLGYGHDPYMTMAPCGVDEGLYGTPGYLLMHGTAPSRLLGFLDRETEPKEWSPSPELFATLRMLYGPEVHGRMFGLRKKFADRLGRAGISISEQQAAYYSTATGENLAWMFRAFGWPVFDYRVRFAQAMIQQQELASQGKLPAKIDGSFLTTWWVRGPGSSSPWKLHTWQGRFLSLATEETFLQDLNQRFFLAIQSAEDQICLLSLASDVQVSFYVNGKRVGRVAAAPQFSQPAHEGWTMERSNATVVPVTLATGENILEMVAVKPAGSKGIWVELANGFGRPLVGVSAVPQRAPDEANGSEKVLHPVAPPILNPSFESGLASWIAAAKDGDGELEIGAEEKGARDGKRCLRLESKGALSGGILQRLVLEENAVYEFSGWIRTEGFRDRIDKAFVGLFTGSPTEGMTVQTDVIEKQVPGWQRVTFRYKTDRRTIYVGCLLRAAGNAKVWFDGLQFVRVR